MKKVYVVTNINGDIIGVADSDERAIEIYLERYAFNDGYVYNLATCDQLDYLTSQNRIECFELNTFYYR